MSTLKTNNIQHVDRSDPSIIINTDGSVNIAGTMTYEDVTNVDAVGIITGRELINAQKQVHVGTGVSVKAGGLNVTAGITTVQALQATTGTFSGVVKIPDGSTSAPSLAASSDTNSGLYFAGADALGLVVGGSRKLLANSSGVTINNGDLTIDDKIIHQSDTNTAIRFADADTITAETGGSERVRIDSDGRVIIGDTDTDNAFSGGDSLVIGNTSSGTRSGITLVSANDQDGGVYFSDGTSSGSANVQGQIVYDHSNSYMRFYTSASERLRITSAGKVNIGDTQMSSNLLNIEDGTAAAIDLASHGSGGDTAYIGVKKSAGGGLTFGISNRDIIFKTGASYSSGTTFDSGNEKLRLLSAGGITFNGDTATANALDDYEEGTWTPDWRGASALGTTTYGSYNVASYVKIGNQVTIRGYSELNGSSGGSGFWFINNLPFLVGGGDDRRYRSVGSVMIENFNLPNDVLDVVLYIERNNNDAQLRGIVDNATSSANISVNTDTNFEIYFTVTYPTV